MCHLDDRERPKASEYIVASFERETATFRGADLGDHPHHRRPGVLQFDPPHDVCFNASITQANELVAKLHDRMPLILSERDQRAWLPAAFFAFDLLSLDGKDLRALPLSLSETGSYASCCADGSARNITRTV